MAKLRGARGHSLSLHVHEFCSPGGRWCSSRRSSFETSMTLSFLNSEPGDTKGGHVRFQGRRQVRAVRGRHELPPSSSRDRATAWQSSVAAACLGQASKAPPTTAMGSEHVHTHTPLQPHPLLPSLDAPLAPALTFGQRALAQHRARLVHIQHRRAAVVQNHHQPYTPAARLASGTGSRRGHRHEVQVAYGVAQLALAAAGGCRREEDRQPVGGVQTCACKPPLCGVQSITSVVRSHCSPQSGCACVSHATMPQHPMRLQREAAPSASAARSHLPAGRKSAVRGPHSTPCPPPLLPTHVHAPPPTTHRPRRASSNPTPPQRTAPHPISNLSLSEGHSNTATVPSSEPTASRSPAGWKASALASNFTPDSFSARVPGGVRVWW